MGRPQADRGKGGGQPTQRACNFLERRRKVLYRPPMPRAPTSRRPELTPRQRWTAALRLADDDPPVLAAALADASPDVVSRLMAEDEGFSTTLPPLARSGVPAARRLAAEGRDGRVTGGRLGGGAGVLGGAVSGAGPAAG